MSIILLFVLLIFFVFLGIPIAVCIGLAALTTIILVGLGIPFTLLPAQMYSGMNSFTLMAIPFFILAGEIMNRAGLTIRILNLAEACVGHIRGGLAHVNIVASMIMAGVSGSGAADTAAIGTAMIKNMKEKGFKLNFAVVLTAAASTVGPIIPPSVLFILYGFLTNVSVGKLFLGGVIPGILMSIGLMVCSYIICLKEGYGKAHEKFEIKRLTKAGKEGLLALIVPFVIIFSITTGFATATESGVIAVVISLILGLIFKTLTKKETLYGAIIDSTHSTAIIFLILATSAVFSNILVRSQFQFLVIDTLHSITSSPILSLFLIIVFILIIGMFVDVTPILIMFATPMAQVGEQLGFDPVFFGVVIVIASMIGSITPPVGGLLLISASIGKIPIADTFKILIPFVLTLVLILLLIVLVPQIVTFLPNLLME
ncbi:TRAP transporter large permease [Bacillus litorisediminis]|uniref:TRAP transporter large permease n=1 Tax=Bacillus litorisediminis TaxID=2922713 RepID=UPI001FAC9D8F|nr:TRAP transporter large permease [Bacillus litorisediminis]